MDAAFRTLAPTPRPLQRALAHAFAHPRLSNLTVSSVAGPGAAALHARLPAERGPLRRSRSPAATHSRSASSRSPGKVCFGILADAQTLPTPMRSRDDLDAAFDELLAVAH